ncbi:PEGA domain-containing protein [Candidatus Parcubacteria bacterium]|nr:PEGA domain-containing protein [Patescibacteria group bacterium]MBU4380965.1 PEGA domain-containing protein [Patescibacteria group bacterium]MCG2689378.1 PEGA domain-containing protein [Candidatus Parcubacteria bacterium]
MKNPLRNGVPIFPVLMFLLLLSWATVMYSQGYRLNFNKKEVTVLQTGILSVRSNPEGAKVYLDGKVITATNSTISSLAPATYKLEVTKDGFTSWGKQVQVYNDKVTDITALLISKSPRIEPLTTFGVSAFSVSNDGSKIAYATKNGKEPGIWLLPLSGTTSISIFGGNRNLLILDTPSIAYSMAKDLVWSPDDKQLLIKMNDSKYYVLDASGGAIQTTPEVVTSPEAIYQEWATSKEDKLKKYLEKINLPQDFTAIALDPETVWSPDLKKFLYKNTLSDEKLEYKVSNFENPLPVGEELEYSPFKVDKESNAKVYWYSDSYHLIVVEEGTVEVIRIDGSNRTEIFTGNLASSKAYPTPGGDKIIVLASFKQSVPPDLYTVSIR